ncbi:hypothetical protein ACIBG7_18800 [Nonomuraea sp. NPDC050328]|uniref:hypothetical protein n=1 Tax=Nonomuraea sp. NPDC050328 TaxID=3364361 RepID=UPI003793C2E8
MVAFDLQSQLVVSAPEWNGGDPVRVDRVHAPLPGVLAVCFQDVRCRTRAQLVVVPIGMELDLVSGGCFGGGR